MRPKQAERSCMAANGRCERPAQNEGLCEAHWQRVFKARRAGKDPDLTTPIGGAYRGSVGHGFVKPRSRKRRGPRVESVSLREALAGNELWPDVPLPEKGTPEYETFPHCGYFGCSCPPLLEIDELVKRLEAMA